MKAPGRLAGLFAALAATLLSGCAYWRPAVVPLKTISDTARCDAPAPGAPARPLLVMLPGRFMSPEEYVDNGFVDAVRRRGLDVDLLVADTHLGYYMNGSVVTRLHDDVVEPARRRGVTQVWLVGISMGAYGAVAYADTYPESITGVVALAPYLGADALVSQVQAGGGLRAWRPSPALPRGVPPASEAEADQRVWRWLSEHAVPSSSSSPVVADAAATVPLPVSVPLYLGYGDEDRFLPAERVLAAVLPPAQVATAPGGHDWDAWRPLWDTMLDRLPLPRRAACAGATGASGLSRR